MNRVWPVRPEHPRSAHGRGSACKIPWCRALCAIVLSALAVGVHAVTGTAAPPVPEADATAQADTHAPHRRVAGADPEPEAIADTCRGESLRRPCQPLGLQFLPRKLHLLAGGGYLRILRLH